MNAPPQNSSTGFTLAEVLISAALTGVIAASLALLFKTSIDLVESSDEKNELVQEARNSLNRIMAELRNTTEIAAVTQSSLAFDTAYRQGGSTESRHIEYSYDGSTLWKSVNYGPWNTCIENVDQFRAGGITLWSTLDDNLSIAFPEIGPGGSIDGNVEFAPAKFDSGYLSRPIISNVRFPAGNVVLKRAGTIEFWYRPQHTFEDEYDEPLRQLIKVTCGATPDYISVFFDPASRELFADISILSLKRIIWKPDWEANSIVHVALVWDSTGRDIGDSQTAALFIDGEQRATSANITSTWARSGYFTAELIIGDPDFVVVSEAVFDNIKVYDYCKTNFDDRHKDDAIGAISIALRLHNGTDQTFLRNMADVR
jgi:hypothetical protein